MSGERPSVVQIQVFPNRVESVESVPPGASSKRLPQDAPPPPPRTRSKAKRQEGSDAAAAAAAAASAEATPTRPRMRQQQQQQQPRLTAHAPPTAPMPTPPALVLWQSSSMRFLLTGFLCIFLALMSGEAVPKNRLAKATQKAIVDKYQTAPNRRSHSSEVGHRRRLGGGPLTYLLTQPPILYFGTIIWMYWKG